MASITQYLDELDAGGVPVDGRAIAALGPKMLALAAEQAVGSIPYSVTPEYTRRARAALGSGRILAPEHKVVLDTDPVHARLTNRDYIEAMLNLRHYRNSLRRLGFTDEGVTGRGSDRLYDALVAHGDVNTIAGKLTEHLDAGADHVAIQVMTNDRTTIPGLPKDITVQVYDDRVFAVTGLAMRRPPTQDEIAQARDLGRRRAEEGLPLASLIGAYHVGYREMWNELLTRADASAPGLSAQLV